MIKFNRHLALIILLIIFILHSTYSQDNKKQSVLIINSYHKGFPWTDNIVFGIESVLNNESNNITITVEYMDTKSNVYDTEYKKKLLDLYKHKYDNLKFDLILVSDDNAFNFIREYNEEVFTNVPIVFCGLNNSDATNLVDPDRFTGVLETLSHEATIDLILKLHPETKKIVLIVDKTPSGKYRWSQIEPSFSGYKDIEFTRISDDYYLSEIENMLKSLTKDTAVIFFTLYRDRSGEYLSLKDSVTSITEASSRPVYTTHLLEFPYGVLGGKVLGGFYHGEIAANIALRVLNGEKIGSIPFIDTSPTQYVFNYDKLKRWGIKVKSLPENSIILNKPESIYFRYKKQFLSGLILLSILLIILVLLIKNIIKLKITKQALYIISQENRKNEQKYHDLINQAQEGIWVIDKNNFTTFVNPSMAKMMGYTSDEMIGKSLFYFMDEKGIKIANKNLERRQAGYKDQHDFEFICKNGNRITTSLETSPIIDKSGNYEGAIAGVMNITKRKKAEEALEWNIKLLNETGEIAHIGGWEIDLKKQELSWTDEVRRIHEVPLDFKPDLTKAINFYTPSSKTKVTDAVDLLIKSGKSFDLIVEIITFKGNLRWVHSLGKGIVSDNKVIKVFGTIQDITEKKNIEKALKQSEEQLHQSQKMDAIGQLAGGIAHDFNNSLAGIIGATDMILSGHCDAKKETKFLHMILTSAERAGELTKKLLLFSRKANKLNSAVDMIQIINETVDILERTIDKNITISIVNNAIKKMIIGDDSMLQNAILNLAINSSHAMLNGGEIVITLGNITLDSEYCEFSPFDIVPGEYLEIDIRDSGTGMSPEIQSHIFEPFFTTKEQGKGTGIGLATVYGSIKEHNGAINVYSEESVGTVFHLYFPVITGELRNIKKMGVLPGSGTILVIDDEVLIRETSKAMLVSFGYKVLCAENGKIGLQIFTENYNNIDLVILDMIMPVMGGREVFGKLREIDNNIPVIISSGFAKDSDVEVLKKQGVSGFIHKPFRRVELSEVVACALNQ